VRAFVSNVSARAKVQYRLKPATAQSQRSRLARTASGTLDNGGHGRLHDGIGIRRRQDADRRTFPQERRRTMGNRSSKNQGSRNQGSQSTMSNRSSSEASQGTDAQNCPTPSEPRRDTSISNDDEEEE
jgi:hypothetical protein